MPMDFDFKVKDGVDFSQWGPSRVNTTGHPFPWADLKPGQTFTIPKSYWVARGMDAKKYDAGKLKERVRNHFRDWQGKDEARKGLMLHIRTTDADRKPLLGPDKEPAMEVGFSKVASKSEEAPAKGAKGSRAKVAPANAKTNGGTKTQEAAAD